MRKKRGVAVNVYEVIDRAVWEGAQCGARRSFKHVDTPDENLIADNVHSAIMSALCEVLDFDWVEEK